AAGPGRARRAVALRPGSLPDPAGRRAVRLGEVQAVAVREAAGAHRLGAVHRAARGIVALVDAVLGRAVGDAGDLAPAVRQTARADARRTTDRLPVRPERPIP